MTTSVAIVLDRQFASNLRQLSAQDIWVIRSPANDAVVEDLRRTMVGANLTSFADELASDSEAFDEVVRTVDLHHGEFSQTPPFDQLEVYGLTFNEAVSDSLGAIGFAIESRTSDGFTAGRVPA